MKIFFRFDDEEGEEQRGERRKWTENKKKLKKECERTRNSEDYKGQLFLLI